MESPEGSSGAKRGVCCTPRVIYWLKRLPAVNFVFFLIAAQADLDNLVGARDWCPGAPSPPPHAKRGSAALRRVQRAAGHAARVQGNCSRRHASP